MVKIYTFLFLYTLYKKCGKGNNIVFEAALMSKYFNI